MMDEQAPEVYKDSFSLEEPATLRILLVEDNKHDTRATIRALESAVPPCSVTTCVRAEIAIDMLETTETPFDVVMSDLHLPGVHGLEFCINLARKNPDQAIVILTGSGSEEMAVRALKAGVSDYIIKDPDGYYIKMLPVVIPQVARQSRNRIVSRRLAQALRESEEAYRAIIETSKDWIWATCIDGRITYSNPAVQSILGYTETEIIGRPYLDFIHDDDKRTMGEIFMDPRRRQHGWSNCVIRWCHKDGSDRYLESTAVPSLDEANDPTGFRGVDRDITERKRMEENLKYLANHDSLTGLCNRNEMKLRLRDEIQRASRYSHPLSVFMLDLDHFKSVNDNYGHVIGDVVLQHFAKTVEGAIRKTDFAARYGGEEFVVILPETSIPKAMELAERLRRQISDHLFQLGDGKKLHLTVSIGIATFPKHARSAQDLLEVADSAMYESKKAGRNLVTTASVQI